jgi:hypothetical protein
LTSGNDRGLGAPTGGLNISGRDMTCKCWERKA